MSNNNGFLQNYSQPFHKILSSERPFKCQELQGAYLPLFIPRLILFFIWNNKNILKSVFRGFFGFEENGGYLLENERVFICACKKNEIIQNLTMKIKSLYRENLTKSYKE